MSACGCSHEAAVTLDRPEPARPWWKEANLLLPALSGVALLTGLLLELTGMPTPAVPLVLFWLALLLGASRFVPQTLRRPRLGISLLMTVSAVGAVLLGHVEEAAALAFLYSLAEGLEDRAMDRARTGLRSLLSLLPVTATVHRGEELTELTEIEAVELRPGDRIRLAVGERLATDGTVIAGHSSLDTSAITGESVPAEVGPGDTVPAGSVNTSGVLTVRADAPGTDNSLTTVVALVQQAQERKGARARVADRIARPLVPAVLVLAVLVAALGSLFGDPAVWIERALVVLVAASPCAIAIAVPVTVISAIGSASRAGVVYRSGAAVEKFGQVRHIAVDKTGTLTANRPGVAAVLGVPGVSGEEVLAWAGALESHSTHPLAAAFPEASFQATDVREEAGRGMSGRVDGHDVTVGSPRWLEAGPLAAEVDSLEQQGMTVVLVARDGATVGAVGIRDELRPEAAEVVDELRRAGLGVTMLTGDNRRTAHALAAEAGITDVRAELHPGEKSQALGTLPGPVAMLGDGINDAPALASADIGIALGATGSDAAVESADIAFTGDSLRVLPRALRHARRTRRIIDQNIILALLIILVLPPLAVTGVLGLAAVVLIHEVAEVLVIVNGLRAGRRF